MSKSLGTEADPKEAGIPPAGPRSGSALIVIAAAVLMVSLDGTITNIALPSIQTDLDVSASQLAWVVNSYVLAFGGLLLIGGRAGDIFGRRRMFRIGLALFVVASLLGGLAPGEALLIASRVLQGVGAAIITPTALSLITTNFPEGEARTKAMGVYGAMAAIGTTLGLLLGGVLADFSWRWVMFVNVPIGLAVLAGTTALTGSRRSAGRLDVPGAVIATVGLVSFVYAITRSSEAGWTDSITVACLAAALVLLALFVFIQARSSHPMMPLRLFRDRSRSGSYATMLLVGAGMLATFYFLTLYMQDVLGYSPVRTGFAYLPFSFGIALGSTLATKVATRFAPRVIAGAGLLVGIAGMLWFGTLEPAASYFTQLLPPMTVVGTGLGLTFVPMTLGAVSKVRQEDSGIASALLNTTQQIGGALGLALLSAVAISSANSRVPAADEVLDRAVASHDGALMGKALDALTHGYAVAFLVAAALYVVALLITVVAVNAEKQAPEDAPLTPAA
ncbi:MFS transporter [Streptomyces albidus (ex Kaewkla and Franco 2022)]|uniref:MFS transporter n=1 Tax=Streptomyces albidus (ex Kaewkla and Franco 2022) TaxID=722709 RepID=UPI0015EF7FA4|nr:MFS transporter [Streptomyces albidus (ex Kaewkla and Franco 2022)]